MASRAMLDLIVNMKDQASKGLGGLIGGFAKLGFAATGVGALISGGEGLVGALGDMGKAAADEKLEIDQLTQAINNADRGFTGGSEALDKIISKAEALAFADSDARASLEKLTTATHSVSEATRLQALAMDFARRNHIDLATATNVVTKVQLGSTSVLKKYGIEVGKGTSAVQALGLMEDQASGAAKLFAESNEGAGIRAAAAIDNAKESIGAAILPLQQQIMGGFAAFLTGPEFAGAIDFISGLLSDGLPKALQFLSSTFGPVLETVKNFAAVLTEAFSSGSARLDLLQQLPDFLQPLGKIIGDLVGNWGEFFSAIGGGKDILTAIVDLIQNNVVDTLANLGVAQKDVIAIFDEARAFLAEAIPAAIQFASDAWNNVLAPALKAVWQFTTDNIFPMLGTLLKWLSDQIPPAVKFLSDAWNNVLQPALAAVWKFLTENVIPALGVLLKWLSENIPPAIKTLSDLWNNTLKPALSAVWKFITDNLIPTLGDVLKWLQDNIPPAIKALADLWTNTLQPALNAVWTFIDTNLLPVFKSLVDLGVAVAHKALEALAGLWEKVISPALNALWTFIDTNLKPVFVGLVSQGITPASDAMSFLANVWNTILGPALQTASDFIGGSLKQALDGLAGILATVKKWFDDLAASVNGLELPDWLTPGSPTPLETGLVGIGKALQGINRGDLAAFSGALGDMTAGDDPAQMSADFAATLDTLLPVMQNLFNPLAPSSLTSIWRAGITGWTVWFRNFKLDDYMSFALGFVVAVVSDRARDMTAAFAGGIAGMPSEAARVVDAINAEFARLAIPAVGTGGGSSGGGGGSGGGGTSRGGGVGGGTGGGPIRNMASAPVFVTNNVTVRDGRDLMRVMRANGYLVRN